MVGDEDDEESDERDERYEGVKRVLLLCHKQRSRPLVGKITRDWMVRMCVVKEME